MSAPGRTDLSGKDVQLPSLERKNPVLSLLNPHNVGELRNALEGMDSETPVFSVEIGNEEGRIKWVRKESWAQWLKRRP